MSNLPNIKEGLLSEMLKETSSDERPFNKKESSPEDIKKEIIDSNIEREKEAIDAFVSRLESEIKKLNTIKNMLNEKDYEQIKKETFSYLRLSEKNFLDRKTLFLFATEPEKPLSKDDFAHAILNKSNDFQPIFADGFVRVTDDYYYIKLPEMVSKKSSRAGLATDSYLYFLLQYALKKMANEGNVYDKKKHSTVIFEHHISEKRLPDRVPDGDNLDTKLIVDQMGMTFFPNDTVLDINTLHVGCIDSKSFTVLHVMHSEKVASWMEQNRVFFGENR